MGIFLKSLSSRGRQPFAETLCCRLAGDKELEEQEEFYDVLISVRQQNFRKISGRLTPPQL
jgi:hypothetical protein